MEEPLPSIRLKSLRGAMELVELAMTQEAGPLQVELKRRINSALGMEEMCIRDRTRTPSGWGM